MSKKQYYVRLEGANSKNHQFKTGNLDHSVKYNNSTMLDQTAMARDGFIGRLLLITIAKLIRNNGGLE